MNLETKITIYKFTPQVFTLTLKMLLSDCWIQAAAFITLIYYLGIFSKCSSF